MPRTPEERARARDDCSAHLAKLNAAQVTWEDLSDEREVERKLEAYDQLKRQARGP